jgi:signal transduction histidine kinase
VDLLRWADAHPIRHLMAPCEELVRENWNAMASAARESEVFAKNARTNMILLGILGPISGLIGGFGVAWGLSRSIARLSVRLRDVHAHLDRKVGSVRLTAVGSFNQLDRQLEQVLDRVRTVVADLQRQQQEVLRAEQLTAVGQLAASVAHEVRNPLTSIKLLVGASLRSEPHKPLQVEDLQVIYNEVQRLEGKVQALLDFARPPESRRQLCNLGDVIRQTIDLVATRVKQQDVQVHAQFPETAVLAYVDRDQFTSVLVNLFMNALDAMPHGGCLTVTLSALADGGVQVSVADTGAGIDTAVANRLFLPFTSNKATGTGLGLSVCRRVVEEHGGQLNGKNRPEGGACFVIDLPAPRNVEVCHVDAAGRG